MDGFDASHATLHMVGLVRNVLKGVVPDSSQYERPCLSSVIVNGSKLCLEV